MPSTYSTNLKIELMATGENSGTWGTVTNTNLGTALEQAIVGYGNPDFVTDANLTITLSDSNSLQAARALVLNVTSTASLTVTRELIVPTIQKQYIVQNNTSGSQSITVKTSAGTGVTIPNGKKMHVYVNGTDVVQMDDFALIFNVDNLTLDGNTLSSTNTNGNIVLAPNGNGDVQLDADTVRVGDSNVNVTITSNGTADLILNTNAGTNSGSITIQDGVDGNIVIAPNGNGQVQISNAALDLTTIEVTNIKAKDGTASMTLADSTGVVTFSKATVIEATDNTNAALRITQLGTGNALLVEDSANPDSTPFVVTAAGDVGIGTNSPAQLLHVAKSQNTDTAIFVSNSNAGTAAETSIYASNDGTAAGGFFASASGTGFTTTGGFFQDGVAIGSGSSSSGGLSIMSRGSGTPIRFYAGGFTTENMRLDSSGNLGLGVTPSGWSSSFYKAIEGGDANSQGAIAFNLNGASNGVDLWSNGYFDGTNSIYKYSATAGLYQVAGNVHRWYNAPSGTANTTTITNNVSYTIITSGNQTDFGAPNNTPGTPFTANASGTLSSGTVSQNISFTQAMTLLANGNLGIGETNPAVKLDVTGAGRFNSSGEALTVGASTLAANTAQYFRNTSGFSVLALASASDQYLTGVVAGDFVIGSNAKSLRFGNAGTGALGATLDASGNLGLGVTPSAWTSGWKAMQIGVAQGFADAGNGYNFYYSNAFNSSTGAKYITANPASVYSQGGGEHAWFRSTSTPVIGNDPVFSQAMTLDASGNLLVGDTSNPGGRFYMKGGYARFSDGTYTGLFGKGSDLVVGGGASDLAVRSDAAILFSVGSAEKARITSGGYFKASDTGSYIDPATFHEFTQTANSEGLQVRATNASYSNSAFQVRASRNTTNNSYYLISCFNDGAGAYRFRVADSGAIGTAGSITLGSTTPATSGIGVQFPATQSASSDANTLDDYEEGTHTTSITCGTSGTVTLDSAFDLVSYTKIGRQVTVTGQIAVDSVSSPVGFFSISLPFAIADLSERAGRGAVSFVIQGTTSANISEFVSLTVEGESAIRIYLGNATVVSAASAQQLQALTDIWFTITYFV